MAFFESEVLVERRIKVKTEDLFNRLAFFVQNNITCILSRTGAK